MLCFDWLELDEVISPLGAKSLLSSFAYIVKTSVVHQSVMTGHWPSASIFSHLPLPEGKIRS